MAGSPSPAGPDKIEAKDYKADNNAAASPKAGAKNYELVKQTSELHDGDQLPLLLTVDEVRQVLRLSKPATYQALHTGAVPGVRRIGRALRVHRATFEKWLATGEVPPRRHRRRRGS